MSYQVIDNKTSEVVGTYKTRKLARRRADKLDLEYGAIRYSVREKSLDGFWADFDKKYTSEAQDELIAYLRNPYGSQAEGE